MKRLVTLVMLFFLTLGASAQQSKIPTILEIAEIEENDETVLSVFNMPNDEGNHYYLSVGTLGIGDEIFQIQFDPLSIFSYRLGALSTRLLRLFRL